MNVTGRQIQMRLNISPEAWLEYYRGIAGQVVARSTDGRTVRFPASILRPHVTRSGIQGLFILAYDDQGKFLNIRKVTRD